MKVEELLKLPFLIEEDEDGVFVAKCPLLKGCYTQGYDIKDLENNVEDLLSLFIDMIKDGEKLSTDTKLLNVTFNKNGKITHNFSKQLDKNIEKKLIGIN